MKLYVIKDVVAGRMAINPPVISIMNNDSEARRSLKVIAAGKNQFTEIAQDIQLWCLGVFDNETGFITENKPYLIGNLIDYLNVPDIKEDVPDES